jgi:hypothetical protein
VYRLQPYEEALGILKEIQILEGYALAQIGPVTVALPEEMASRLTGLQGQRVGILRTERDFRFRIISSHAASLSQRSE